MTKLPINIYDNRKIIAFTPDGKLEYIKSLKTIYPANTYFYVPRNAPYKEIRLFVGESWFRTEDLPDSFWRSTYIPSKYLPERILAWKLLLKLD